MSILWVDRWASICKGLWVKSSFLIVSRCETWKREWPSIYFHIFPLPNHFCGALHGTCSNPTQNFERFTTAEWIVWLRWSTTQALLNEYSEYCCGPLHHPKILRPPCPLAAVPPSCGLSRCSPLQMMEEYTLQLFTTVYFNITCANGWGLIKYLYVSYCENSYNLIGEKGQKHIWNHTSTEITGVETEVMCGCRMKSRTKTKFKLDNALI